MADTDHARQVISRQAAKASGLARYFTGIPCSRGHIAERRVRSCTCVLCMSESRKAFYYRHREAEIGKVKAYYQANRKAERAKRNAYDKANPEKKKVRFKAWYDRNKEARAKQKAEERKANPDLLNQRYKRWASANPEHVLANVRRRYARKKLVDGHHTGDEIKALFKRQRGRCAYCRTQLKSGYHADHIIPLSKGGSNWITNIQLTCASCNQRKWAKDPIAWAKQLGRLL